MVKTKRQRARLASYYVPHVLQGSTALSQQEKRGVPRLQIDVGTLPQTVRVCPKGEAGPKGHNLCGGSGYGGRVLLLSS